MNFLEIVQNFKVELGFGAGILGLLLLSIFSGGKSEEKLGTCSIILVSIIFFFHLFICPNDQVSFNGTFVQDPLSYIFKIFFFLTTLFVLLMAREYVHRLERGKGEFYLLILLASLGMILLASAVDFILLFVSLELITVSFYIMTAYLRTDAKSIEAGLKYLILGALSSGFLLYGISFIYGITGSTHFQDIAQYLSHEGFGSKGLLFGFLLILAGLGFKIASVPFQLWVPDVYEGAPTPIAAFLSVGSKGAGFLMLLRLLLTVFPGFQKESMLLLSILSAMTLIYGNLGAIPQKNIKRFLGYSSIGHAGYLLMGLAAGSPLGASGVVYYLFSYLFTNLGAFLIVTIFSKVSQSDEISDYAGLSQRSPLMAGAMLIALMSLAGVPPLSGFFGKFLLISAAVQKGLVWLAMLGAVNVIISLYYYLMIIKQMYIYEPLSKTAIPLTISMKIGISTFVAGILILGIFQEPILKMVEIAVKGLF